MKFFSSFGMDTAINSKLESTERGLKYEIKRVDSKSTEIYVTNLITEKVTSSSNVNPLLREAKKNRAVAATNCNERSSR